AEPYSSHGPVTLYWNPVNGSTAATALGSPSVLNKPDFTATDGGQNPFFGGISGGVHRFFGTSQAAPHAAAGATLMRSRNLGVLASSIDTLLKGNANPLLQGQNIIGAGLIQAPGAVKFSVLANPEISAVADGSEVALFGRSPTGELWFQETAAG